MIDEFKNFLKNEYKDEFKDINEIESINKLQNIVLINKGN